MYVIIPSSDIETSVCPLSKNMCKTLVPINGKPVLQYILDELYSYQEYIDQIIIVKKDPSDIEEFIQYNTLDDFFKTKIHVVQTESDKSTSDSKYSIMQDFYSGLEYLVDKLNVPSKEILLWSGDELATNTRKFTDFSTGSFICEKNLEPVKIYRFDEFPYVVNINLDMNESENLYSIDDFIKQYSQFCKISKLNDFGDYFDWSNSQSYYDVQQQFVQNDSYQHVTIEIDTVKQQITKYNKIADLEYTTKNHNESKKVQAKLFAEADVLDNLDAEQQIFFPRLVEAGITLGGDLINDITEEYVAGSTLESLLLNESVGRSSWKSIIDKLVEVISTVLHKDDLEREEVYWNSVEKKNRNNYADTMKLRFQSLSDLLAEKYSAVNYEDNLFVLSNQEVVEWKIFIDKFIDLYDKYINSDNIIYQGSFDRIVHGNLSFDNIIYDQFTSEMKFIKPIFKMKRIVNKMQDYAMLYLSAYTGFHSILNNKYIMNEEISIPESVVKKMDYCIEALDEHFTGEESKFLKMYAIVLLLDNVLESSSLYSADMLNYIISIKNKIYFDMIIS